MQPDDLSLPYEYTKNTGPASKAHLVGTGLLAGALCVTAYFGLTPWAAAAVPLVVLAVRFWLFSLIHNAVHLGLRNAEMDAVLDEAVTEQITEQAKRTLTPGFMSEALLRSSAEEGSVH
jgi:hypothetical protein